MTQSWNMFMMLWRFPHECSLYHQLLFLSYVRLSDNLRCRLAQEAAKMILNTCKECGEQFESEFKKEFCTNYCRKKNEATQKSSFFKDVVL